MATINILDTSSTGFIPYYDEAFTEFIKATGAGKIYNGSGLYDSFLIGMSKDIADITPTISGTLSESLTFASGNTIGTVDIRGTGDNYFNGLTGSTFTGQSLDPSSTYFHGLYARMTGVPGIGGGVATGILGSGADATSFSSGLYSGSFTTDARIYDFDTIYDTGTQSGSGIFLEKSSVIGLSIFDRLGEDIDTNEEFIGNPFISGVHIDIMNSDGSIAKSGFLSGYRQAEFVFGEGDNVNIFGSFATDYGIRTRIVSFDEDISTGNIFLHGNRVEINSINVVDGTGSFLDENPINFIAPNTGLSNALPFTNRQKVSDFTISGAISLNVEFEPTVAKFKDVQIFATSGDIGSLVLDSKSLIKTQPIFGRVAPIRLVSDDGLDPNRDYNFKLIPSSDVATGRPWIIGPYRIAEKKLANTNPIFSNVGFPQNIESKIGFGTSVPPVANGYEVYGTAAGATSPSIVVGIGTTTTTATVGIGTSTAPTGKNTFEVVGIGSTAPSLVIGTGSGTAGVGIGTTEAPTGNTLEVIGLGTTSPSIVVGIGSTATATVGIGTSAAPTGKNTLEVVGIGSTVPSLVVGTGSGTAGVGIGTTEAPTGNTLEVVGLGTTSPSIVVGIGSTTTATVGIGTTQAPTGKNTLEVVGIGSTIPSLIVGSGSGTAGVGIGTTQLSSTGNTLEVVGIGSTIPSIAVSAGIGSTAGFVGIGSSDPSFPLDASTIEKANIAAANSFIFSTGSAIFGGANHTISGDFNVIAGGSKGHISGNNFNFIGGGTGVNVDLSQFSSSIGGFDNDINSGSYSVIGGGRQNLISGVHGESVGDNSAILGGQQNKIVAAPYGFIGGGANHLITGSMSTYSAILGGNNNQIKQSQFGVILGGDVSKIIHANHALTAGNYSTVQSGHNGAFVLSDSRDAEYKSSGANTLNLRFQSGLFLDTDSGIFINGNPVVTGDSSSEGDTLQTVTTRGGTTTRSVEFNGAAELNGGVIINENGQNADFRVEGSSDANALFVQGTSNNVGIGTNNPLAEINTNAQYFNPITDGKSKTLTIGTNNSESGKSNIILQSNTEIDNEIMGGVYFAHGSGQADAHHTVAAIESRVSAHGTTSLNGADLLFFTKPKGAGRVSGDPQLFIGDNEEVGIGTGDPACRLHVNCGANEEVARFESEDNDAFIRIKDNTDDVFISHDASDDIMGLGFTQSASSSNLNITSAGNVGIGTTSPAPTSAGRKALHVKDTSNGAEIRAEGNGSTVNIKALSEGFIGTQGADKFHLQTNNSNRITINTDGHVGIGTVTPLSDLTVYSSDDNSATASIHCINNNETGALLRLAEGNNHQGGFLQYDGSANKFNIGVHNSNDTTFANDTKAITIDRSSADVGIGTTNPTARLEIQKNSPNPPLHIRPSDGSAGDLAPLILYRNQLNGSANYLLAKSIHTYFGTYNGGAPTDESEMVKISPNSSDAPSISIGDDGSTAATLNVGGNISLVNNGASYITGGNVGVGTNNPQEKLHVYNTGTAIVEVEGTNGSGIFKATNSQGSYAWYVDEDNDSFRLYDFTDSADRIMITGNGNVSIGTTEVAPHKLNVKGTISRLNTNGIQVVNLQTASEAGQVSVLNAGGSEKALINSNGDSYFNGGDVGIGTNNPTHELDLIGEFQLADTASNSTNKVARIRNRHYTNTEEPMSLIFGTSTSSTNVVQFGGGTSTENAATKQVFFTAPNNTTTLGTQRMHINSVGKVGIGSDSAFGTDHAGMKLQICAEDTSPSLDAATLDDSSLVISNEDEDYGMVFGVRNGGQGQIQQRRMTSAPSVNNYALELQPYGGNVGIGTEDPSDKLQVNGSFSASSKTFNIEHPTQSGKRLIHGCFEGPEHGVYFRGKTQDSGIQAPEYWSALVDIESMTADVTPIGPNQSIYVERIDENGDVYVGANTNEPLNYFYIIYGERKDVDKLEVVKDNPPPNTGTA